MRLIIISSGLQDTQDIRDKLKPQIINSLIEEQVMLQEAERLGIKITDSEINDGFKAVAAQNNFSPNQFFSMMRQSNIPIRTMKEKIEAEIAWSRVIQSQIRPRINITEADIDSQLSLVKANIGKNEYLLSEIFLAVETPKEEKNVRRLADRLVRQIREQKIPFPRVAVQFSQSAAAAKGGNLGWVQEGQLAEQLETKVKNMREGELSPPIRSLAGYHILLLAKKRTLSEDNLPSRDEIANQLGMAKMDRLQRRYLLDLKTASYIDRRA